MPNSLDVAIQRKRIEELQRDGLSTQEAEAQLRAMLDAVTWRCLSDAIPHFKKRA
jgi:hypothetical protein